MALNNTYSLTPQPYSPGMVADARLTQTVSRIASAAIKAGQAAVRDANRGAARRIVMNTKLNRYLLLAMSLSAWFAGNLHGLPLMVQLSRLTQSAKMFL